MKSRELPLNKIVLALVLAFSVMPVCGQTVKKEKKNTVLKVTFTVTEMDCETDRQMVVTALYRKKGVKNVQSEGEIVTVTYKPEKVSPDVLKETIESTGTCEEPSKRVHVVKIKEP